MVQSEETGSLYLTLYAMLKKAMDGFGRVVGDHLVHSEWLTGRHFF